jgi:Leucine-rich repeat (LRR) protein
MRPLAVFAVVCGALASLAWAQVATPPTYSIAGDTATFWRGATEADWAQLDRHPEIKRIVLPTPPDVGPPWTITPQMFAHVAQCPNLEEIYVGPPVSNFSDDALRSLAGLKKLRVLHLFGPLVSDAGIAHLASLKSLEELRLDFNDRIGDASVAALENLTNLEALYFYRARLTDAGVARLRRLTRLETLTLGYAQVGDKAMDTIAGFRNLQSLDLQHTRITDEGLAQLRPLTSLRWIGLNSTRVTSRGIANLADAAGMTHIEADDTQIGDEGLAAMRRMTGMSSLYIANTKVTEAGLRAALPAFPELAWLRINGLPVTDAIVPTLLELKKLKNIEMNQTRITAAGEARLKAAGIARVNVQ